MLPACVICALTNVLSHENDREYCTTVGRAVNQPLKITLFKAFKKALKYAMKIP